MTRTRMLVYGAVGLSMVVAAAGLWLAFRKPPSPKGPLLLVYCDRSVRSPLEAVAADYRSRFGVTIQIQPPPAAPPPTGDLWLGIASEQPKRVAPEGQAEQMPVAVLEPVLAIRRDNAKSVQNPGDLVRPTVSLGVGDVAGSEIGRMAKRLFQRSGQWDTIEYNVRHRGEVRPTETELANDLTRGRLDAAIIWRTTADRNEQLMIVPLNLLGRERATLSVGLCPTTTKPAAALHFARFLTAPDAGLAHFASQGFSVTGGDPWINRPTLNLVVDRVLRNSLRPIFDRFAQREGVDISVICDDAKALESHIARAIQSETYRPDAVLITGPGVPKPLMDSFESASAISATDLVICVAQGNPKGIKSLDDLKRPGVRVAVANPMQVSWGAVTKQLLEQSKVYQPLTAEDRLTVVIDPTELASQVASGVFDAAIVYRPDAIEGQNGVEVVAIDSPLAQVVQTFTIARSSRCKLLSGRLRDEIYRSDLKAAGFDTPGGRR